MNKRRQIAAMVGSAFFALGAGYLVHGVTHKEKPASLPSTPILGENALLTSQFLGLNGKIYDFDKLAGQIVVVNFWATWCAPCRKEAPEFVKLQNKYREQGLTVIGIAIDNKENTLVFVDEVGINYPVLLGDLATIELSRRLGNRFGALPFTTFLDRNHKVATSVSGAVSGPALEAIVAKLLVK